MVFRRLFRRSSMTRGNETSARPVSRLLESGGNSQFLKHNSGRIHTKDGSNTSVTPETTTTWTYVAIGSACGFLLLILVVFYLIKRRSRTKQSQRGELSLEDISGYSIKEPTDGHNSRRWSSVSPPSAASSRRGTLVRSMTLEDIPDFSLPPERIQPVSPGQKSGRSKTALQYQQSLLGCVQPDLYRYSEDEDDSNAPPSVCGRIWFSVLYDIATEQLSIHITKARHLPGRGRHNNSRDPFVKVYLLPDEKTCQQTKAKRKTLSPMWNENLMFQASAEDISERILRLSVYDVDRKRVRHSLGHVLVPMKDLDLTKGDQETIWRDLEPASQAASCLGELYISLTYIPNMEKIKVVILRAKNLSKLDYDNSGTYAKVQLFFGRRSHKTKKTASIKGSSEPVYNESMNFHMGVNQLDSCSITVTMMYTSTMVIGRDQEYGKISVGPFMFARGEELLHWQEMIAQPRTAIAKWHTLSTP